MSPNPLVFANLPYVTPNPLRAGFRISEACKMEVSVDGHPVLMDDEDYFYFCALSPWRVTSNNGRPYLVRKSQGQREFFHRMVAQPGVGHVCDHINGDPLDNRRSNLRVCRQADNLKNRKLAKHSRSGFKGVHLRSPGRWEARITADGRRRFVGSYGDPISAALAYDAAAHQYHGEFAKTNRSLGLV